MYLLHACWLSSDTCNNTHTGHTCPGTRRCHAGRGNTYVLLPCDRYRWVTVTHTILPHFLYSKAHDRWGVLPENVEDHVVHLSQFGFLPSSCTGCLAIVYLRL